jgi:uncharacterized protein (TIGR00255 family)
MTGFGRASCLLDDTPLVIEIKGVNHRYNDVKLRLPSFLFEMEHLIRQRIQEVVARGRTEVIIRFGEGSEQIPLPHLNKPLLQHYLRLYDDLLQATQLPPKPLDPEKLFLLPNILTTQLLPPDPAALKDPLFSTLEQALQPFLAMRAQEGANLRNDLSERLNLLRDHLAVILERAPALPKIFLRKLQERLRELPLSQTLDPQRLHQEIVHLIDKSDISEEITRFRSHLDQFDTLLLQGGSIGRRLDFLCQELHREANTMSVKSQDAEILKQLLPIKAEIEKIREQVQNIE